MTGKTHDYTVAAADALYGREPITPLERARVYHEAVTRCVEDGMWPLAFAGGGMDADAAVAHAKRHLAHMERTEQWLLDMTPST